MLDPSSGRHCVARILGFVLKFAIMTRPLFGCPCLMPITRSDIQRVAPKVLARLADMASVPTSGTVAGQAVASLMYEELGLDVRGPINDIDVFVDINMPRELRGKSAERQVSKVVRQKTAQAGSAIHSEKDGYGHIKFIAMRTTLKIAHTYRAGLINYTLVSDNNQRTSTRHYWKDPSAHPNPHPDKMSQDIVDGFDLNLVSVGINLASGAAVCSDEFLEFCNTRIIKAQTANTPCTPSSAWPPNFGVAKSQVHNAFTIKNAKNWKRRSCAKKHLKGWSSNRL